MLGDRSPIELNNFIIKLKDNESRIRQYMSVEGVGCQNSGNFANLVETF